MTDASATDSTPEQADPSWVVARLTRIPGVKHAVVATTDGMLISRSEDLSKDTAEQLAACVSSLWAGGRAIAELGDGELGLGSVLDTAPLQYDGGFLFVRGGTNCRLAVATAREISIGPIGFEMEKKVRLLETAPLKVPGRLAPGQAA